MAADERDLRDLWCSAARQASDAQLIGCVAIGLAAVLAFAVGALIDVNRTLRWWPVILPALLVV